MHDGASPDQDIARAPHLAKRSGSDLWRLGTLPADLGDARDPLAYMPLDTLAPSPGGVLARIVRYEPGLVYPVHTTSTVDFVQRGTPHSWKAVGEEPCVVVFVMIDAERGPEPRQP